MGNNVYQTKNYFIAAYHYVQCYGTDLVVPSSTAEVAQAMAHYHKRAQVGSQYDQTLLEWVGLLSMHDNSRRLPACSSSAAPVALLRSRRGRICSSQ